MAKNREAWHDIIVCGYYCEENGECNFVEVDGISNPKCSGPECCLSSFETEHPNQGEINWQEAFAMQELEQVKCLTF